MVADSWARLPVRDAAVDRVLVVFAPRNGRDRRVLRPGGRLVVVTPAADHLAELIGTAGAAPGGPGQGRPPGGDARTAPGAGAAATRDELGWTAAVATLVGMGPHARL